MYAETVDALGAMASDKLEHQRRSILAHLVRSGLAGMYIGAAIVPFYGQEAGDQLTALLTTHIEQAVPVLTAAQDGDQDALDQALADWYGNAEEIADFLSAANPDNWPRSATRPMMEAHIDTTTIYAVDLLGGDYTAAIADYEMALEHMTMMADTLSAGLIAQFPDQFSG